jgi:hypothetical protein
MFAVAWLKSKTYFGSRVRWVGRRFGELVLGVKRLLHATKLFQRVALRKTRVISKYLPLFLNLKVRSDSYVALAAGNHKMERLNERVA